MDRILLSPRGSGRFHFWRCSGPGCPRNYVNFVFCVFWASLCPEDDFERILVLLDFRRPRWPRPRPHPLAASGVEKKFGSKVVKQTLFAVRSSTESCTQLVKRELVNWNRLPLGGALTARTAWGASTAWGTCCLYPDTGELAPGSIALVMRISLNF